MVDFEVDIKNAVTVLQQGGTILYPTDTVWGIGCSALHEVAIDKVFAIKQRPQEKALIVLLAEAKDVLQYVAAPPPDIIAIIESFEVPTTVIYKDALGFPDNAVHEDGSIAIRVTTDPFCKALIKRLQQPLVSTSANISGMPAPAIFSGIDKRLLSQVDYVVRYRQNDTVARQPSQIIRIHEDESWERLR